MNEWMLKECWNNYFFFDFSTLYTTIPHNLLFKVFNKINIFVFNYKKKIRVGFSESSVNWTLCACNFFKINAPPWVFFSFFKLYKWYEIAQSVSINFFGKKVMPHSLFSYFFTLILLSCGSYKHPDTCFSLSIKLL